MMTNTTLRARAGSSLRANLKLWQAGQTAPVDTTGSTFSFTLRRPGSAGKILLTAVEYTIPSPPLNTVLVQTDTGEWTLFLGKTLTQSLPTTCPFEFRLTNDANPEDSVVICAGTLHVEHHA